MRRLLIWIGAPAGALVSVLTAWTMLGLPRPAFSTDIQRLDRQQVDNAINIYQDRVNALLSIQPPTDPAAHRQWRERLRRAQQYLDAATQRKLDMSK